MICFLNLDFEFAGELSAFIGCRAHPRLANLAAQAAQHGYEASLVVDERARNLAEIARAVKRSRPELVVMLSDRLVAPLVEPLRELIESSLLVLDAHGSNMEGQLSAGDLPAFMAAIARLTGRHEGGFETAGERGPFALGLLPPALAGIGVEMSYQAPDGGAHAHPIPTVLGELAAVDRRLNQDVLVPLVGAVTDPPEQVLERWREISGAFSARHVRLAVQCRPHQLLPDLVEAMATAGVGQVSLLLRLADHNEPLWDLRALRSSITDLQAQDLEATIHVDVATANEDGLDGLEALAALAQEAGVTLTWATVGSGGGRLADEVARIALIAGSPTSQRRRALGSARPLLRLLAGRYATGLTGASGPREVLLHPDLDTSPARLSDVELLRSGFSLDTLVFGPQASGSDRLVPRRGVEGLTPDFTGSLAVCGQEEIEVLPYLKGRDVMPFTPVVLRILDRSDLQAFVADADGAFFGGELHPSLVDPLVKLGDECAWSGEDACMTPVLARLVADGDGGLRPGPVAPRLGNLGEPVSELRARAVALVSEVARLRGCEDCPVRDTCSKDTCLLAVIPDGDYCEVRRSRPWLPGYIHGLAAARLVVRPETDRSSLRVSGLGGPLLYNGGALVPPVHRGPVLLKRTSEFLLVDPSVGSGARIGSDAARIVEALIAEGAVETAAASLAADRGISEDEARAAVEQVFTELRRRKLLPAGEAPGAAHR